MTGKHGRKVTARERRAVERRHGQLYDRWVFRNRREDDRYDDEDVAICWRCDGEGFGVVGLDWDNDDPINDDDGDAETCDCCGGSGLAEDCVYW